VTTAKALQQGSVLVLALCEGGCAGRCGITTKVGERGWVIGTKRGDEQLEGVAKVVVDLPHCDGLGAGVARGGVVQGPVGMEAGELGCGGGAAR